MTTCEACHHWDDRSHHAGPDKEWGICRAGPPTHGGWPDTMNTDWCGQHKPSLSHVVREALSRSDEMGPVSELFRGQPQPHPPAPAPTDD